MSGLSQSEMEGCHNLLGLLDNDEIMSLCDTVTNRLVQPKDRQGTGLRALWSGGSSGPSLMRLPHSGAEPLSPTLVLVGPEAARRRRLVVRPTMARLPPGFILLVLRAGAVDTSCSSDFWERSV